MCSTTYKIHKIFYFQLLYLMTFIIFCLRQWMWHICNFFCWAYCTLSWGCTHSTWYLVLSSKDSNWYICKSLRDDGCRRGWNFIGNKCLKDGGREGMMQCRNIILDEELCWTFLGSCVLFFGCISSNVPFLVHVSLFGYRHML